MRKQQPIENATLDCVFAMSRRKWLIIIPCINNVAGPLESGATGAVLPPFWGAAERSCKPGQGRRGRAAVLAPCGCL